MVWSLKVCYVLVVAVCILSVAQGVQRIVQSSNIITPVGPSASPITITVNDTIPYGQTYTVYLELETAIYSVAKQCNSYDYYDPYFGYGCKYLSVALTSLAPVQSGSATLSAAVTDNGDPIPSIWSYVMIGTAIPSPWVNTTIAVVRSMAYSVPSIAYVYGTNLPTTVGNYSYVYASVPSYGQITCAGIEASSTSVGCKLPANAFYGYVGRVTLTFQAYGYSRSGQSDLQLVYPPSLYNYNGAKQKLSYSVNNLLTVTGSQLPTLLSDVVAAYARLKNSTGQVMPCTPVSTTASAFQCSLPAYSFTTSYDVECAMVALGVNTTYVSTSLTLVPPPSAYDSVGQPDYSYYYGVPAYPRVNGANLPTSGSDYQYVEISADGSSTRYMCTSANLMVSSTFLACGIPPNTFSAGSRLRLSFAAYGVVFNNITSDSTLSSTMTPSNNSVIACPSGTYGATCEESQQYQCSSTFKVAEPLSPEGYMSVTGKLSGNSLTFAVTVSPLTYNRTFSTLSLGGSLLTQCIYPGQYWTKNGPYPCSDNFNAHWDDWILTENCGWTVSYANSGYRTLHGYIYANYFEEIAPGITRTNTLSQAVSLWFKNSVDVSTLVQVDPSPPVEVKGFVTEQSYALKRPSPFPFYRRTKPLLCFASFDVKTYIGKISFSTSTPYPFYVQSASIKSSPYGISAKILSQPANITCPGGQGSECIQTFAIQISRTYSSICTISGSYSMLLNIGCRDNDPSCPISSSVTMTANVKSSDFCGNVYVNAGLNGTLTSFSNLTFATPQTKFGLGIRQFFLGQVASAEAHIRSTRLGSVTLRSASYYYSWTLYDGGSGSNVTGSITSYGTQASFTIIDIPGQFVGFSFIPYHLYSQTGSFQVYATIIVSYTDGTKRTIQVEGEETTGFPLATTTEVVETSETATASSPGVATVQLLVYVAVALASSLMSLIL